MADGPATASDTVPVPSQAKEAVTSVASMAPGLHTFAATGKVAGPVATLLLSSPMTSQVITETVSCAGAARAGMAIDASSPAQMTMIAGSRERIDTKTSKPAV